MPRKKLDLTAMERRIQLTATPSKGEPQFRNGKPPAWVPRTKVIICGTRTFDNYPLFKKVVDRYTFWFDVIEVVIGSHGKKIERDFKDFEIGADAYGKRWAEWYWWKYYTFWPDWDAHGKRAGPVRNREMAQFVAADKGHCVTFWDGKSPGTGNMIEEFLKCNHRSRLYVHRYKK